jgi:hypothetical protein
MSVAKPMATINRANLVQVHLLLAAFVFPVAVMFFITGAFYTWGIKGDYVSTAEMIPLDAPLTDSESELVALIERELDQRSVSLPSGSPKVKKSGTSFQLEWTGSKRDVVLEPTADDQVARLTIKETSWYRNFVQLHKAKGGVLFKVYAAVLAVALLTILSSGFLIAWQIPKYRSLALRVFVAGLVVFIAVFALS